MSNQHNTVVNSKEGLYYSCQQKVPRFGKEGQARLSASRCLIIGLGGLGCPVAQYLALSGVGYIGLCDMDTIELSNISRQILYCIDDVGKYKCEVAYERIKSQNPYIHLQMHKIRFNEQNWEQLLADYDYVIDCTDNFSSKFLIHDACLVRNKTLVQAGIFQTSGQVFYWPFAGPLDDSVEAVSRKKLDQQAIGEMLERKMDGHGDLTQEHSPCNAPACLRCIWETVPQSQLDCDVVGVMTSLAGIIALKEVNVALLAMLQKMKAKSMTYIYDWERLEWTMLDIPQAEVCVCNSSTKRDECTAYLYQDSIEISSISLLESAQSIIVLDVRDEKDQVENEELLSNNDHSIKVCTIKDQELADFERYATDLDKSATYILVCYRGRRSLVLAQKMRAQGLHAYSLIGGYHSLCS